MLNSRLSMIGAASIAYLLAGPVLGEGWQATAACTTTSKSDNNSGPGFSMRTIVNNNTKHQSFYVAVYLDNNTKPTNDKDMTQKESRMQTTMYETATSTAKTYVVTTKFSATSEDESVVSCQYSVRARHIGGDPKKQLNSTWDAGDPVCGDMSLLCENCKYKCEKSYISYEDRWTTRFTISD